HETKSSRQQSASQHSNRQSNVGIDRQSPINYGTCARQSSSGDAPPPRKCSALYNRHKENIAIPKFLHSMGSARYGDSPVLDAVSFLCSLHFLHITDTSDSEQ